MRLAVIFFILALIILGSSAVLQERHWQKVALNPDLKEIKELRRAFQKAQTPLVRFSLINLPQIYADPILTDPKSTDLNYQNFSLDAIKLLKLTKDRCQIPLFMGFADVALVKAIYWEVFLCDKTQVLTRSFFETPPFMHPSGKSYAYLAYKSNRRNYHSREWLTKYRTYLHMMELPELKNEADWHPIQGILANLNQEDLINIWESAPVVLSNSVILFQEENINLDSRFLRYEAYAIEQWQAYLKNSIFKTNLLSEVLEPLLIEGNMAWFLDKDSVHKFSGNYKAGALLGLFFLSLAFIAMGFNILKQRLKEQEERLFVLQTLTHELRTPATALKLHLENLRTRYDSLPSEAQADVLHILEANSRLARVLEASTQYLKADQGAYPLKLNPQKITSIQEFIYELVEGFELETQFSDNLDFSLTADSYWLGICIFNLLENAFKHGTLPVKLIVSKQNKFARFEICDSGNVDLSILKAGQKAFNRSKASDGLGLGLTLVEKIVKAMRGQIKLLAKPTRFIIYLPL